MKLRRIDRFKRRPSDAHLLTPPDINSFRYVLNCSERLIAGWQPLTQELAANGIQAPPAARYAPPYPLAKLVDTAVHSGVFDSLETWEETGGLDRYARITRRPKISPKLLANLTPLQRQRLHAKPTTTP